MGSEKKRGKNRISAPMNEDKSENLQLGLDYNPTHFLRCHSKKNDSADVQTQVWQCAFEPDVTDKRKTTSLVATCGGNSVCFIDTKTGSIPLKYYAKDLRELFYALTWTVNGHHTFLACGGSRCTVHFIHPAKGIAFHNKAIRPVRNKNHINSLFFHPAHWNVLICGSSLGEINICTIGSPSPPEYEMNFSVIQCFSTKSEVFSMSFCPDNNMLLTGCDDGLTGWHFSDTDHTLSLSPERHWFQLPPRHLGNIKGTQTQELVDSVEVVERGVVAIKCALHGAIYLWSLTDTLKSAQPHMVRPTHVLRFSDTDNYFMSIGIQPEASLLCCGDDKGQLWLYDLDSLETPDPKTHLSAAPTAILPWPTLTDLHTEKKRKLAIDTYDIVVDKVTLSSDRRHIVAVTNNNIVCVWERIN